MNRLATFLAPLALALAAGAASAAPQDLPPPGLYRVDTDTRVQEKVGPHDATIAYRTDGSSGDQTTRATVAGHSDDGRVSKGSGPVTQCIRGGAPVQLPVDAKGVCKTLSSSHGPRGFVQVAACPAGKSTLTMRRLDDKTWETIQELDMSSGSRPDLGGTRTMLELAARHGETARERAEAAEALARLPRMEAAMAGGRAQADAMLQEALARAKTPQEKAMARQAIARMNGQVPIQSRTRSTMTRIADRCPAR